MNSKYISRDISWLRFNERVLDQAKNKNSSLITRLYFLMISATNLDEFFMIRIGSLYNYIDYEKKRIDISGLTAYPLLKVLLAKTRQFIADQHYYYLEEIYPFLSKNGITIQKQIKKTDSNTQKKIKSYFDEIIYPMLTPMVFDRHHTFPILMNNLLILAVATHEKNSKEKKISFIQIPKNLPRFYIYEKEVQTIFVPIEKIIQKYIASFFNNVIIDSITLLRITRNGDFSLEENDDIDTSYLEEFKKNLKKRETGRVVRLELEENYDEHVLSFLKTQWQIEDDNCFVIAKKSLINFQSFVHILEHKNFKDKLPKLPKEIPPINFPCKNTSDIFTLLENRDILLHHPYNSINIVTDLLEKAAEDPYVLSIKLTIYRLTKKSSHIINALLKAAENGKHVSVLFEIKARFDEENNIQAAQNLQKAGCFVIYGVSSFKTHSKLLLIVRKKAEKVTSYVHISSGNYNEETSRLYTDIGLLTTNSIYAQDVSSFFNAITGHSKPRTYKNLITAPNNMRKQLLALINNEIYNTKKGLKGGIIIKINALEDQKTINALYKASQAGVSIKLIVRGICCLIPGKKNLSENIMVKSIVGNYLEHARIYYFHNNGNPNIYLGSADVMVRSFERRIEALCIIQDTTLKHALINILDYNLKDNYNSYYMQEDGKYKKTYHSQQKKLNIHEAFFKKNLTKLKENTLF